MSALILTMQDSLERQRARRVEQIGIDEFREAGAVWGYLSRAQRLGAATAARVPLAVSESLVLWVKYWPEIKGGLVWAGYDLNNLRRAAMGCEC